MLSPEIQAAVDEIRRNKSLVQSLQSERDLWKQTAMDAQGKLAQIAQAAGMSAEDKAALQAELVDLDHLNDELEGAAHANVVDTAAPEVIAPTVLERDPDAPRPDPLAGTGQNGTVPLMPNSAFDPNPQGAAAGQPQTIETAGGFVIGGGGQISRAPGSDPASPSSSLVAAEPAPVEPVAADPAPVVPVDPAPVEQGVAPVEGAAAEGAPAGLDPVPNADPVPASPDGTDSQKAPA